MAFVKPFEDVNSMALTGIKYIFYYKISCF